jgi:hypothetical protein
MIIYRYRAGCGAPCAHAVAREWGVVTAAVNVAVAGGASPFVPCFRIVCSAGPCTHTAAGDWGVVGVVFINIKSIGRNAADAVNVAVGCNAA